MLKNILNLDGVKEVNKKQLKKTLGGHYTGNLQYTCWDETGELFDSSVDASYPAAGIHCTPNAEVAAQAPKGRTSM